MKAYFCRKVSDLQELIDITKELIENRAVPQEYFVTDEIVLNNDEFKKFANDFYEDQEWISEDDGGIFDDVVQCVRVVNYATNDVVLVNSEGYNYPRYTAIEL